ncbi:hypothetical protein Tco_1326575 [Tanacetum coccineum]
MEKDLASWCRAFFAANNYSASFENGIFESFNYRILNARGKPIITMLEDIRIYLILWVVYPSGRSSYARAMIELRADVELRDNIVAAMPKISGEAYYTCNIRVEYEWKPPRCACCKLGTNGGTSNLASQATNSSGSSFWNIDASSPSTTSVIEKIDKIEKLFIEGKVTLVDDDDKPLEKVASSCDYDSEDEVASVDNGMAKFLAKKDGYGTQSLLEQWTESYEKWGKCTNSTRPKPLDIRPPKKRKIGGGSCPKTKKVPSKGDGSGPSKSKKGPKGDGNGLMTKKCLKGDRSGPSKANKGGKGNGSGPKNQERW